MFDPVDGSGGTYVTPDGQLTLVISGMREESAFVQTCGAVVSTMLLQIPLDPALPLIRLHSAYCCAISAACSARCFSRRFPASFSWVPKLRNMLTASMVAISNINRAVISATPR